ncbi:SurA N-terminal domain-containing protein [Qipengyuania sp. DY56-A-20]|uniref:Parvulin-like PPIase n=1 Tax=Qipengyuania benthica TaxID=3067651 RepID=A0ABT9H802_9SPHN|nr:SurA N-terminal domain-containing protein [Qipengyuania sp. DY56-A-20]MDP4539447.1 SurA N-terminal domain-containing protein [Qipengyuania sp. DY56-A-20]
MLLFFRSFFKSKFGLAITFAFLALIAFAFASSDVANTGMFGGVAGGERVAVVGDERIDSAELAQSASTALDRLRQDNPALSMPAFIAQGGLEEVLDQLIARYAIATYAERFGLRAGDNLINSEIRQIGAFRGPDGNFSADAYNQTLAAQGLTDAMVRQDIGSGLLAQQMLVPASFGATIPLSLATRYARLFKERREGAIGFLPSGAFFPEGDPSAAQLQAYYQENRGDFIRPERRVIRYALFGEEEIEDAIAPTDAEIAARYRENSAEYAASEARSFTQLIVPTQQAAQAIRQRVAAGASFASVAQEAGFRTSTLEAQSRAQVADDASPAVAQAYFDAARGAITEPTRSPLGWHVARVDSVETTPGRSLAQVSDELASTIREEKRVRALVDLAAQIEERIDDGETLTAIAQDLGLTVRSTPPVTADGGVYGTQGETISEEIAPVLETAFQMEESEPQVGEVARGDTFAIFETADITASAAAPLAEIREDVITSWKLAQGSQAARAAADRVLARLRDGATMASALAAEDVRLPAAEQIALTREDLARRGDQRIPPPLALLFSMAEGTSKRLEATNNLGWFVVDLDDIELGEMAGDDPLIAQAQSQLGETVGQEYADQLVIAMREAMGVERNETAIDAVRRQLAGER